MAIFSSRFLNGKGSKHLAAVIEVGEARTGYKNKMRKIGHHDSDPISRRREEIEKYERTRKGRIYAGDGGTQCIRKGVDAGMRGKTQASFLTSIKDVVTFYSFLEWATVARILREPCKVSSKRRIQGWAS